MAGFNSATVFISVVTRSGPFVGWFQFRLQFGHGLYQRGNAAKVVPAPAKANGLQFGHGLYQRGNFQGL